MRMRAGVCRRLRGGAGRGGRRGPGLAGPDAEGGAVRIGAGSSSASVGWAAAVGPVPGVAVALPSLFGCVTLPGAEHGPSFSLRPSGGDGFPRVYAAAGRGDRGDQEGDGL